MKATDIKTAQDARDYIEGTINDLLSGVMTKEEAIESFADYTIRICQMANKLAN